LNWSCAVTVKLRALPAVAVAGAETAMWVAAAADTAIVPEAPVIELLEVSVAVRVWFPAVCNVAENVPVPLLSVESAGSTALPSELVKWTVSPKAVMVLLFWSRAVTVRLKALPAVAPAGAATTKCGAATTETAIAAEVPAIDPLAVSLAVMVWFPVACNVAEKVPAPFVSVESAGSEADPSELVKWMVSVNEVTVPACLTAVTVKLKAVPATALAGADTLRWRVA